MRWLVGSALLATSCGSAGTFECRQDEACRTEGVEGRCEASGFCSFPDDGCPTGRRYGAHAGTLAHECVTDRDENASSSSPSSDSIGDDSASGAETSASSTGPSPSTSEGTSEDDGETTLADGTTSSTSSGQGSTTEASSSSGGALLGCEELYGDLSNFTLCEEGPTTCEFQASTERQTCAMVCEARGGSCLDGWDDGVGLCERSDTETGGCEQTYVEQICLCTREG